MSRDRAGRHHRLVVSGLVAVMALGTSLLRPARAASSSVTERVSIGSQGQQGNDISGRFAGPAINSDGHLVAFDSIANTLVPGDTNVESDVFVHDRTTSTTERVSVGSDGRQANGFSSRPALNASGNLVVFDSAASNLVRGDINQALDVFVHARTTNTTERVSVSSGEAQGHGASFSPSISGHLVTFVSSAPNLVPNDTNGVEDIFVRDLVAGTTERVSLAASGQQGNSSSTAASISESGRWVAFSSFASNLVPGDTNGAFDVFIHDRATGLTEMASVNSSEALGNASSTTPSVSGNGRLVAFWSDATNLVRRDTNERRDVFVRDRAAGTTERVSVNSNEQQADGNSEDPAVRGFTASGPDITPDGRFVTFFASATNLVPGDTNTCPPVFEDPGTCPDVFVRDRVAGTTVRVDLDAGGNESIERSSDPVISHDGLIVAFFSASNLVPSDTNICPGFTAFPGNCPDIFIRDGTVGALAVDKPLRS
jgi:hypothetical protein